MTRTETILFLARQFLFVREVGGQNTGVWVQTIQKVTGNAPPDSWCASFTALIMGLAFGGKSPLPRSAGCDAWLEAARKEGWLTQTPSVGDIFLRLKTPTDAVHIGFVTDVSQLPAVGTISGNTSEDGTSSNGDRVAERFITPATGTIIYIAYPR
jgi:hypothetical protein